MVEIECCVSRQTRTGNLVGGVTSLGAVVLVFSHLQVWDSAQQHGGALRVLGYLLPEVVVAVELFLLFLIATIIAALSKGSLWSAWPSKLVDQR